MEHKFNIKIDYDEYGWPYLKYASDLLELVRIDARMLQHLRPDIGKAVIKRSFNGFHLEFPLAKLSREEAEYLSNLTHGDTGYLYWLNRLGKATLRIGRKVIVKKVGEKFVGKKVLEDIPFIIEILEVNGSGRRCKA